MRPLYNQSLVPLANIFATGASGTRYQFQLDRIGTIYFERPGVYIFCKFASNGSWDAIYVGETDNFWRRLTDELAAHRRWERIRAAAASHICTLHIPGHQAWRLKIETDLRHGLKPPCNEE